MLVRAKKPDHAAALLKAVIRRGAAEPWMYEALALLLEATGADKDELARTLLSAADVVSDSPNDQLRVARLLAKHDLKPVALRLYRDVSESMPLAPEPYSEGLDLAVALGDGPAARWAAIRLLSQAWPENQAELYKKARARVTEMEIALRKAGKSAEADALVEAVRRADTRDLVIRLTWQGESDIDLKVLEPLGTVCSTQNRMTPAGGVLVTDGHGKDVGAGKNPAEVYVCSKGLTGPYEIRLDRVWGEPLGGRCKLEVTYHEGAANEHRDVYFVSLAGSKPIPLTLDDGRRTGLLAVPQVVMSPTTAGEAQLPIQQLRALADSQSQGASSSSGRYSGPQGLFQAGGRAGGGAVAFDPEVRQFFFGSGFSAQAVISADRRYVRISVLPNFTTLTGEKRFLVSGGAGNGFR